MTHLKATSYIKSIKKLTKDDIQTMFGVFSKYYEQTSLEKFSADLMAKDDVIIIQNSDKKIVGFSTLKNMPIKVEGKTVYGIFSGDTILEREYWGTSALGKSFIKYLLFKKLSRPYREIYWFLISKGYKTYLLMANNFLEYYPRFDKATPERSKKIMDSYASELYGKSYVAQTGLIHFQGVTDHLAGHVAPISEKMREENAKINFFSEANPDWKKGNELVCLALFDFSLLFRYLSKKKKSAPQKAAVYSPQMAANAKLMKKTL